MVNHDEHIVLNCVEHLLLLFWELIFSEFETIYWIHEKKFVEWPSFHLHESAISITAFFLFKISLKCNKFVYCEKCIQQILSNLNMCLNMCHAFNVLIIWSIIIFQSFWDFLLQLITSRPWLVFTAKIEQQY